MPVHKGPYVRGRVGRRPVISLSAAMLLRAQSVFVGGQANQILILLGDPLVSVVVDPGGCGGVPVDVLSSLQVAPVFKVGRNAVRPERVAANLIGVEYSTRDR